MTSTRPTRLGGYKIERTLGRGRTGVVYLAVQESLSRPVALKLLDPRLAADADFVRRFRAEAEAAAALNHPHVVTVHDFGEADGQRFLSMEYMPGGSLEDALARGGPLPWPRVLEVLHDAARALVYAESRGVVHRDIKPANLMLGAGGIVKLADLGLATGARGALADERVFGTPHFVSPEQARGEAVGPASDLYSLGATAYRLLTGRTPFDGASTREILRAQLTQAPSPPRELVPELPAALDALVLRLLAKEPEARPRSARALLEEIEALQGAAGRGPPTRAGRRWIPVLGAGLLGALLFAVLVVAARRWTAQDAEPSAVAAVPSAPRTTPEGRGGAEFLEPAVQGADPYASLESELAALEDSAREALAALDEPDPERRQAELRELSERFPGTPTAARARREADELAEALRAEERRAASAAEASRAATDELRGAVWWPASPDDAHTLVERLAALRSYDGGEPARSGLERALWEAARSALAEEVAADALAHVQAGLARADELAREGRFEALPPLLAELVTRYGPPEPAAAEPFALTELRRALDAARARAGELAPERERWLERSVLQDRARLAAALGPRSGFLERLRALELDELEARLAGLAGELRSERARALVDALLSDVRGARAALAVLAASFDDPGWRRRSIVDVRSGRGNATVAAASAQGVWLEGDSELVPWSRFAEHAAWLLQLFHERLARPWSTEEASQVAALLRLSATAEAAGLARAALASEAPADAELLAAFAPCQTWNAGLGAAADDARLAAELDAARVLLEATRAASEGAWTLARERAAELLERADRSLLVALLCDGSESAEPAGEEH